MTTCGHDRTGESCAEPEHVVLDFETTGLSPCRADVIETGAVLTRGGRVVDSFTALSRPSRPIPLAVSAIHGITDEMVMGCPPFADVLPHLLDFVGDRVIVAHHARFDVSFLAAAVRRAGLPPLRNEIWCTVRLSRRLFPGQPRHDLDSLCVAHSIRREAAHRALSDARATAEVLRILLGRAREEGISPEEVGRLADPSGDRAPVRPRTWTEEERTALEEAIVTGDRVQLCYVSRRGQSSSRIVVPYAVHDAEGAPRLVAYDLDAGRTRTFRLDRVVRVGVPGGTASGSPPDVL